MCDLYNITTTRGAVMAFTKAFTDKAGWNGPALDVYPSMPAPIILISVDGKAASAFPARWHGEPADPTFG